MNVLKLLCGCAPGEHCWELLHPIPSHVRWNCLPGRTLNQTFCFFFIADSLSVSPPFPSLWGRAINCLLSCGSTIAKSCWNHWLHSDSNRTSHLTSKLMTLALCHAQGDWQLPVPLGSTGKQFASFSLEHPLQLRIKKKYRQKSLLLSWQHSFPDKILAIPGTLHLFSYLKPRLALFWVFWVIFIVVRTFSMKSLLFSFHVYNTVLVTIGTLLMLMLRVYTSCSNRYFIACWPTTPHAPFQPLTTSIPLSDSRS